MKQTNRVLLRHKLYNVKSFLRRSYYKFLGMEIQPEARIGRIECLWPNKVKLGTECEIEDNVVFKINYPFAENNFIKIGDRVFIGNGCEFNCSTKIVIGNDCLIASKTTFADTSHEIDPNVEIREQPRIFEEILVSDDVWIGTQCIILKGVTIGKGSVIGAGSLVNKSIPEYQIWAGRPARFIKNR